MKSRLLALLILLAGCAAAVEAARLGRRLEAEWKVPGVRIDPEVARRLRDLEEPLVVTFFVTEAERMPAHLTDLEDRVVGVLDELAAAADGRVRRRTLYPGAPGSPADPQRERLREHAGRLGVAPGRTRRVVRDGFAESEVFASLRLTLGARPAARIDHVRPEHLELLPAWIAAEVDAMLAPRAPVFALVAPSGFDELSSALAGRGEVRALDEEDLTRPLPPGVDVLFWLAPGRVTPRHVATVERFVERGGDLVLAADALETATERTTEGPRGRVRPAAGARAARDLFEAFGVELGTDLLVDALCGELAGPSGPLAAPWLVRAIAPNQDFRGLAGQPNGHLLFAAPTELGLEARTLERRGLEARILASTSDVARSLAPDPRLALVPGDGERLPGTAAGRRALAVWLEPEDPRRGRVFALTAATPFRDRLLAAPGYAHSSLLDVLVRTTAAPERSALRRASLALPPALEPLDASTRRRWRFGVVGLLPGLLLLLFGLRSARLPRRGGAARRSPRGVRRVLVAALSVLALVLVLGRVAGGLRAPLADWSAGRASRLPDATARELRGLGAGLPRIDVELVFSAEGALPAPFRARLRAARDSAERFARADSRVRVRRLRFDDLDAAARLALVDAGAGPRAFEYDADDERRVAEVVAAIRLSAPDGEGVEPVVLPLPAEPELEDLDLLLLLGLRRLAGQPAPRVAWLASTPRLSPAEALLEFQNRGLFAPTEGDVFQRARRLLADHGLDLSLVDAAAPPADEGARPFDLVVWMQPRRDATQGIAFLTRELHAGGSALVCAQHFEILARKLDETSLDLAFWPRPEFPDVSRLFLEPLGLALERRLFFDALFATTPVWTRVDRAGGAARFVLEEQGQPFQVRAAAGVRPAGAPIAGALGDLYFPSCARITLQPERLAERGLAFRPLVLSSERCWTFDWKGGDVPPDVLDGTSDAVTRLSEPQPLAALVEGRFPRLDVDAEGELTGFDAAPGGGEPGRLLLCGASMGFENPWLSRAGLRQDRFLLASVAELALGRGASALFERRIDPGGTGLVAPAARARWRGVVLGAGPSLLLLLELLRRAWSRARPPAGGRRA